MNTHLFELIHGETSPTMQGGSDGNIYEKKQSQKKVSDLSPQDPLVRVGNESKKEDPSSP